MDRTEWNDEVLVLFGISAWDYVTSLWFEYRLISRKTPLRWEFVPYFLARYFNLAAATLNAVCVFVNFDALPVCTGASLRTASIFLAFLAIVFSTWNLLIRTIIIWGHHPLVVKPLVVVGLLHFTIAVVFGSIGRPPCVPLPASILSVTTVGITTAVIELGILVLSLIGIRRASRHRESRLAQLLKTQGIAYFVMVTFMHVLLVVTTYVATRGSTGSVAGKIVGTLCPLLSCRLVTSTLSQTSHACVSSLCTTNLSHGTLGRETHRIDRLVFSGGQNPSSGRISPYVEVTKSTSESVC